MIQEHPKVFVSHASEDKDRFVLKFAAKLRGQGIDAWVDEWEILPGDSLIDRIFEEGIKNARAMIVVLSKNSVDKPWVREELNAGIVKKISGKCKLIPVVIDDCEVPEALKSTAWQKISDVEDYEKAFERIIASVYDETLRPPLGPSPRYTRLTVDQLPGISYTDSIVFSVIIEKSLETGSNFINTHQILGTLQEQNISEENIYESIDILADRYFIKGQQTLGSKGLDFFSITPSGFEKYARRSMRGFNEVMNLTLLAIVNLELTSNKAISEHLGEPRIVIDYVLDLLKRKRLIKTTTTLGNNINVHMVTTKGQRVARNL